MDIYEIIQAIILGIVEGLTEFLPVSSTAHLIIFHDLIGFKESDFVFEIVIQLGAILAICYKFWRRIMVVSLTVHRPESRKFILNIIIAVVPALVIGAFAHGFIKEKLFDLTVIGCALVVGGFVIILIEGLVKRVKFETVDDIDNKTALKVGLFQCLGMIPGVSRSGATIIGAMASGMSRQAAAEFSFFLAIPTMCAATAYDLYKSWNLIDFDSLGLIAIGFVTAFISALIVVNVMVDFISRNGFKPFAYYRIIVGTLLLAYTLI